MTSQPLPSESGIRGIERRSIDYIPAEERHGGVTDQGRFWFLSNFHFFAIAIGFVGPSLKLSLPYTALAGTLGIVLGTLCQAFHASQGAELGLPQMIQSRAQFGHRGVMIPLLGTLVSLLGYNVVAAVLIADGAKGLWGIDRLSVAGGVGVLSAALAIWGYDWIHRVFRWLFYCSLPLYFGLSVAILAGKAGGSEALAGPFLWPAFLTQMAAAASFNVTAAPYVSDYSRYLPAQTPRWSIIANVFAGSALSAIWLIILGAWLATHLGESDSLVALHHAGEGLLPGLGSLLAAVSIAALGATVGTNSYSAMITSLTTLDCFRTVNPTGRLRVLTILVLTLGWTLLAALAGGNAVAYVNTLLVLMLYFLIPWSAVNLIDYFIVRRGVYRIDDLLRPGGAYGDWNLTGLGAYAAGFIASIPFFVIPDVYTGVIARHLGGIDIAWLVGLLITSLVYLVASRRYPAP